MLASPVVADPLRLLDICATSDGAAALIVASAKFAREHLGSLNGVPSVRAVSTVTPRYPQHLPELPDIATDSTAVVAAPDRVFKDQIIDAAYAEAGIGPGRPEPGRGLRPVHRAGARLVRAPGALPQG